MSSGVFLASHLEKFHKLSKICEREIAVKTTSKQYKLANKENSIYENVSDDDEQLELIRKIDILENIEKKQQETNYWKIYIYRQKTI